MGESACEAGVCGHCADTDIEGLCNDRLLLRERVTELEADIEAGKDRERRLRRLLVRMHPKANAFWQGEIATLLRELEAETRT